jgi:hypothetical protein
MAGSDGYRYEQEYSKNRSVASRHWSRRCARRVDLNSRFLSYLRNRMAGDLPDGQREFVDATHFVTKKLFDASRVRFPVAATSAWRPKLRLSRRRDIVNFFAIRVVLFVTPRAYEWPRRL